MPYVWNEERINQFRAWENELGEKFPHAREEANRLALQVIDPSSANADEVWGIIWQKPLYANTRVEIANAAIDRLKPYMQGAWRTWGYAEGEFLIHKIGNGSGNEAFEAVTPLAEQIRNESRIAMRRLFTIQGSAVALRNRANLNSIPYADLPAMDIGAAVDAIRQQMGWGWGPITVLHFLTDFGLACKPDMHLVGSVRHLFNQPPGGVAGLTESIQINQAVRNLLVKIDGVHSPARLRYLDKTLMDISREILAPLEIKISDCALGNTRQCL